MSINGSQRRDQRRRLVVSWNRSSTAESSAATSEPRPMAEYGAEAHPEKQRGPATLLPTGLVGMSLAAAAILLPMTGAIALGACEPFFGRPIFKAGGRFAHTLQVAAVCFDPRSLQSLAGWLAQMFLVVAAGVALIVRLMRRHRRDDYNGRYRAWGWLAGLFLVTAVAGTVPLGPLFGAAMSDASGIAFGPGGIGWWIAVATVAYAAVSLWAVLPLHERAATAFWLTLSLSAWSASAACTWLGRGRELLAIAAQASWSLGGGLAAVAMLAAARSVIREVRGQCRPATARSDRRKQAAAGVATKERAVDRSAADEELPDFTADPADDPSDDSGDGSFVDGSEQEQRHLSKAERKRLKKLARMNRVAA